MIGMAVLQIPLQIGVLPALEHIKISPALARAVNAHTESDVSCRSLQVRRAYAQFLSGPAHRVSRAAPTACLHGPPRRDRGS